jgi:starch-binding outer membrane protein, SusD/RagB family
MKRKNIILTVFAIAMLTIACEKQLELSPVSTLTNGSFWQTEDDANAAYYGMMSTFRAAFDDKLVFWGEFRSNNIWWGTSGGAYDFNNYWNNTLTTSTSRTNWSLIYMLINDANLILKHVPDIDFVVAADKDKVLGAAYFMRAFSYFQLARIWGDAPISIEAFESTTQELNIPREPVAKVFEQAKADVEKALALLKDNGTPGKNAYFVSKTAAQMLKADIFLWTAKVENGGNADLNTAKIAIDAVLSSGYILEPSFSTVFRNEGNKEVILTQFYSNLEEGRIDVGTDNLNRNNTGATISGLTLNGASFIATQYQNKEVPIQRTGSQWIRPSDNFVANILKPASVDTRTDVTYKEFSFVSAGATVTYKWINKYLGSLVSGARYLTDDIIIYRYAEAVLMKAEIENALNNAAGAITELNKIAKRAYGVDNFYASGLNKTAVDNAILDEIILEFVVEGKSFFATRRMGQAFTRINTLVGRQGDYQGNILLSPVNQDVINRNTKVVQTPGW